MIATATATATIADALAWGTAPTFRPGACPEADAGHTDVVTYAGAVKCRDCGDLVGWIPCEDSDAHADMQQEGGCCDHCGEFVA